MCPKLYKKKARKDLTFFSLSVKMKVTDKKFLNVHQTIGPMTLGSVNVTSSSNSIVKDGTNGSSASAASGKADKLLVSLEG